VANGLYIKTMNRKCAYKLFVNEVVVMCLWIIDLIGINIDQAWRKKPSEAYEI